MLVWVVLTAVVIIVIAFVVKAIKTMLKIENESNEKASVEPITPKVNEEYKPESSAIDLQSSNNTIMTDMSADSSKELNSLDVYPMPSSGFSDNIDNEFEDFRKYARSGKKGRRRMPEDFDMEGEMADEYIPSSPDFSYLPKRQPKKKKALSTELNELPTELKVLMLSDIFDRKFFD